MKRFRWHHIHHGRDFFEGLVIPAERWLSHRLSASFERSLAVARRAICALLLASVTTVGWADDLGQAQKPPTDLTELSLEELMNLDVLSINVLGTHTHLAGEWMFSYQYMFVSMDGNRDGTRRISDKNVLKKFEVAPTDMTMEMHMPMVMYAPSDDLTLMAMLPRVRNSMNHITREDVRSRRSLRGSATSI